MRRLAAGATLVVIVLAGACTDSADPSRSTNQHTARITGTLVEKLDAPPYSYLRLETDTGPVWAAVPITGDLDSAKPVTVVNGVPLKSFEARALGKKFDTLLFGTLERR
jgi:hypothetical protein